MPYRARTFGGNPLYGILNDHWQNFVAVYEERFEQTCGALRRTATRGFCPSCQARQSEEWARWFAEELSESVHHRQIVFTIPKILRAYFLHDRALLTELARAAHRAVSRFVESTC